MVERKRGVSKAGKGVGTRLRAYSAPRSKLDCCGTSDPIEKVGWLPSFPVAGDVKIPQSETN